MRTLTLLLLLAVPAVAVAAEPNAPSEVIQRQQAMDQARRESLRQYIVTRRYVIDNTKFHKHAEMVVRVTYTYPGEKQFEILEQSGNGWIRKNVLKKMIEAEQEASFGAERDQTRVSPQNYDFAFVRSEIVDSRMCHVFQATPRSRNKNLFEGLVWIDAEDAAVRKIEGSPAKNPSFWTRHIQFSYRYEKYGEFWLPESNHSETDVRIFGKTIVTIENTGYQVNKSDETRQIARAGVRGGAR